MNPVEGSPDPRASGSSDLSGHSGPPSRGFLRSVAGFAQPAVIAFALFAAGALVSFGVHRALQRADAEHVKNRIAVAVDYRVRALRAAMRSYEDSLQILRTLYTFSDEVRYEEFVGASREILGRYPAIGALEWAPLVQHRDRALVEQNIGTLVRPGFQFLDRPPGAPVVRAEELIPSPEAPEYMPLIHIEPLHPNQPALGFNLLSGSSHQEIALSRQDGRIMLSRVTPLFVSGSATRGFVLYCPVYHQLPARDGGAPREEFIGMLMAVFRLDRFFADAPDRIESVGYDVLVIDHTERSPDGIIALHREDGTTLIRDLPSVDEFITPESQRVPFELWGRNWEIVFRPSTTWLQAASRRQPYTVLVLGLMISGVVSLLLHNRLRYTAQIEREVAERTSELEHTKRALEDDIARRTQTERALAQSEERYRAFMTQSADAICRFEFSAPWPVGVPIEEQVDFIFRHGIIAESNLAMAHSVGRSGPEAIIGKAISDLWDPRDEARRDCFRAFVAQGFRLQDAEATETRGDGPPRIFVSSIVGIAEGPRLIRAWGTRREITDQRRAETEKAFLERKLQEGQKLESLGVLAGGIAHDFNNLLTGILGNAGLLNHALSPGSALQVHVREIEAASLRAAELCKQMLAYSGKGRFVIETVDLSRLVQDTVPLLRLSISKSAKLHFQLDPEVPMVMADITQLRQILMNLVINASDALSGQLGEITLRTGLVQADRNLLRQAVLSPSVPEGPYAYLEVRDTGCGMPPETIARIFDPFFTTKFAGRGLGLAAVLGIVRGHMGALFVESTPGRGSLFRLLLPVAKSPPPASTAANAGSRSPWRHSGRVLLVDDEEAVRFVGSHMLQSFGFTVDSAPNGAEGIALFEKFPGYDLVIVDLTMPGMSGDEVLRRIRTLRPDVRVLLMSGFSEQEVTQRVGPDCRAVFIQKPFTVEAMRTQLRSILEA